MIEHFQDLIDQLSGTKLERWATLMPEQIETGLSEKRYGDLSVWKEFLYSLPKINTETIDITSQVRFGSSDEHDEATRSQIESCLEGLIPWRKGPFNIHGTHINTEWRSDWKWDRLTPYLKPLENKLVLDVGCGNGYHCWRMLGMGASRVIGIDPSPRFVIQFEMIKHFFKNAPIHVLPVAMEAVPEKLQAFDTTFSMGVLYHRRSPIDHLKELKNTLKPGGQLILETLIVDGELGYSLVPEGRYAMMNNVWFLPSPSTLISWLKKIGFTSVELVDINETTTEEQRKTPWMEFHSLEQFLDPEDQTKTLEGYPRPKRAIFSAINP